MDIVSVVEIIYAAVMVWAIVSAITELQFTVGQRRYYDANHINGVRKGLNRFYLDQLRSDIVSVVLMLIAAIVALTEHFRPHLIRSYHLPAVLTGCLALAGVMIATRITRRLRSRRDLSERLGELEERAQAHEEVP
ncbi:MAG TPA: hypothetical protein VKU87_06475 [Thermomicrobiaceae bacterium]|nr:hypothetical protein [Thermomicrobiaceae bacterium]